MTPEQKRVATSKLLHDFLGDEYVHLKYKALRVTETENSVKVRATIIHNQHAEKIEAQGSNLVNACVSAFRSRLSSLYETLDFLVLSLYKVQIKPTRVDGLCLAEVQVTTPRECSFYFVERAPTIFRALFACFSKIFEFFANAEAAFRTLRELTIEATSRGRSDLVHKYKMMLAQLVEVNNYERLCH